MKLMKLNEFFKDQLERERITNASDWKHNCNFFFPNHAFYYSSKFMILNCCMLYCNFIPNNKERRFKRKWSSYILKIYKFL